MRKFSMPNLGEQRRYSTEFSFGDIAGYTWDINPVVGVYTDDSFTTPVASDGDAVGSVSDQSGNGHNAIQSTAGNKGTWRTNVVNGLPVLRFLTDDWLSVPTLAGLTDQSGAMYMIVRRPLNDSVFTQQSMASSSSESATANHIGLDLRFLSTVRFVLSISKKSGVIFYGNTFIQPFTPRIATWKSTGSAYKLLLNGFDEIITIGGGGVNNGEWYGDLPRDNFRIGSNKINTTEAAFANIDIARILYYTPAPSVQDEALILAELASIYGLQLTTKQVICDGDSLTFGFSVTNPYPQQLEASLLDGWRVINDGVSGATTANLVTQGAGNIDTQYNAALGENILIAWAGTNDIINAVADATIQSNYQTYCAARQLAGYKVIATTLTPHGAAYETKRGVFNAWLSANWNTFADGLLDLAADPTIGEAGDENNLTYYQADKVHLTNAGYTIVAALAKTAVLALV